ncbi:MAG: LysR family transcriptional regulator [Cryobacterium sp.]|nr:LysR family transcriptional regulator [Oligoflexia bacterium]
MSLLGPGLEAFIAIAKLKTVHAAAKELRISQTGVTQRIRSLEKQLQATLFTRSRRGMLLSTEGDALYRYCLSARELEGAALAQIQGAGKQAIVEVCITGPTSALRTRVLPVCARVSQANPKTLFRFKFSDSEFWIEDLRTGVAQIALVPPEFVGKELQSKLLKPEEYVMVGPKSWKKRSFTEVVQSERIIDFEPSDRTSFRYLEHFGLLEQARPERHFANNTEAVASLIESGMGYGVLTHEFAQRFLERCEIVLLNQGRVYAQPLALAWYPRPETKGYWTEIIRSIR